MKILLLLICFISTGVFAGEPKERWAGIKDATGKNSNNFSRGLHNNGAFKNDPVKSKNGDFHGNASGDPLPSKQATDNDHKDWVKQGTMNSVKSNPSKPMQQH